MTKRYLSIALLIVIVSVALALQSFLPGDERSGGFQERLNTALKETESRYKDLVSHLTRYLDGQKIDVDAMSAQRDLTAESALKVSHCFRETSLPDREPVRSYLIKFKASFYNLSKTIEKFKEVIAYISEHNPGKDADFIAVLEPLDELAAEREKLQEELIAAQKKVKLAADNKAD